MSSKSKPKTRQADAPDREVETAAEGDVEVDEEKPIQYAFPTRSRCPRCGVTQTEAYSTKGPIQYRRCLAPICRHNYQVYGTEV